MGKRRRFNFNRVNKRPVFISPMQQKQPMKPEEEIKSIEGQINELEYRRLLIQKNKEDRIAMRKTQVEINVTEQLNFLRGKLEHLKKTTGMDK